MLDKLLGSIFDFASTPRGLLSILAGVASAKDRRRDTPAYGGGVSYGMPGPRRLEAVKGLGRYADVMGFSNGGQTVDIRQPLRYGYAQGPYGPLLAYDIPNFAPTPAPAPEAPRQTQATESKIDDYGYEYTAPTGPVGTYNQQINDFATDIVAGLMTRSPTAMALRGLGEAAQYALGKTLNARPGAMSGNAPIESRGPTTIIVDGGQYVITPDLVPIEQTNAIFNKDDFYGGGGNYSAPSYSYGTDDSGNAVTDAGLGGWEGWATGGEVRQRPFPMQDGGFVMTKRAVDGAGGPRGLAQLLPNARPIRGPGTGTSDSIPATIQGRNGVTPAKVSNGESYVPPEGVEQAGGARQLYALMNNLQQRA